MATKKKKTCCHIVQQAQPYSASELEYLPLNKLNPTHVPKYQAPELGVRDTHFVGLLKAKIDRARDISKISADDIPAGATRRIKTIREAPVSMRKKDGAV